MKASFIEKLVSVIVIIYTYMQAYGPVSVYKQYLNTLLHYKMYCILCCCAYVLKMLISFAFSDGMSRSGVFITCMCEIERVKVEGAVDIFQTVKATRAQRPHMVYTSVSDGLNYVCNIPTLMCLVYYMIPLFIEMRGDLFH